MDKTTLAAISRRFPLLSRPRPACPTLAERVTEITQIALDARRDGADVLAESTHALNKAALLVSDCGLTDLARDLCWQQINIFRDVGPALSVSEAGYMLAPVLNLARLDIRDGAADEVVDLLERMVHAVKERIDLDFDGRTLQLAKIVGTRDEHKKLHEWAWKACLSDGIRAFANHARWDEAVSHAARHRGIGLHLMDGRQASIVAACLNSQDSTAVELLDSSILTQPWERDVANCLRMLCLHAADTATAADAESTVNNFLEQHPVPGYAPYHARLGMTVVALAAELHPKAANRALAHTVEMALKSADGYAARELLGRTNVGVQLQASDHRALSELAASSGLGVGELAEPLLDSVLLSTDLAKKALSAAIGEYRG
ncbi:MAG TPA: hypothetical protein VL551_14665 [Actinospica sp.]|jgi:hypothetical protein|nr:hypothetical protein [Actinospica sp.]